MGALSLVSSIPPATRALTGALLFFSSLIAVLRWFGTDEKLHFLAFSRNDSALQFPWLVIVPGTSFWYPWTLLTAAFCETSLIEFLVSAISLPLAGLYLERIWGPVELIRFTVIIVVLSNIIAWGLAVLVFVVFRTEFAVFGLQYHGLEALQVAFLVALTQLIPEHAVQLFRGAISIQVKGLPMLYVTFSNIMCLLGYSSPFILIQFGWLISWAYLRFFKVGDNGIRGDRSETFAFISWFPPFTHPVVSRISSFLHGLFVRLRIIKPWTYQPGDLEFGLGGSNSNSSYAAPPQSSASRAEAERRRAMALKALDQRMAGKTGGAGGRTGTGGGGGAGAGLKGAIRTSGTSSSSSSSGRGAGAGAAGGAGSNVVFSVPEENEDELEAEEREERAASSAAALVDDDDEAEQRRESGRGLPPRESKPVSAGSRGVDGEHDEKDGLLEGVGGGDIGVSGKGNGR
ncbi:hypothetical protein A4X06_0g6977 [Tilletia controversa]|uniref:Uncharacterized protein n=1 Tax=Tilletia controversa TaxID=13291 RepID=A0A8X7SU50_9BASI|nr:hypothetical protein CF328_g7760 [Tilletia controversa]KAE8242360.1 hypothetical protein A4X06_0g6977 [Tilletia controversa]